MMTASIPFLLSALLATPALWLLFRTDSRTTTFVASFMLLGATAAGYAGIRAWKEQVQPSASFIWTAPAGHFQTISPAQLPAALARSKGQPVMIEFYADWCPSCVTWKQTVFNRRDVQHALEPLVLLQIDATELTPDTQRLLDSYGLPGLPAIVIHDRAGHERPKLRLLGEMKAEEFVAWIEKDLMPSM